MDVETVRRYCLSLPHATEGMQWGDNLLFRIAGKMFTIIALDRTPNSMAFKCTPENFAELTEREGIIPAPYMARNNWVMLETGRGQASQKSAVGIRAVVAKAVKIRVYFRAY
jgi:predicted DNA-binding protein (MmcQ/YjbR family)